MALENKLGITESAELAREEERISKTRAVELYEKGIPEDEIGKFAGLARIHQYLFGEIYAFAGQGIFDLRLSCIWMRHWGILTPCRSRILMRLLRSM